MKTEKLTRFVASGEVTVEDRGEDLNRPLYIGNAEQIFLLYGPPLFRWLVNQYELKVEVEKVAQVSHATMSRWLNTEAGKVFGQRHDVRSYRSIWFGYPSPYPGFDRIVEELYTTEDSFLSVVIAKHGMKATQKWMRQDVGFGLEMLDAPSSDIFAASDRAGVPYPTARRWMVGRNYTGQWRALDNLTKDCLGMTWLEAVLYVRPCSPPRQIPKEALRRMIEESLESPQTLLHRLP